MPDYSIHYFEPHNLLIAHMRYVGQPEDYEKDMAQIGEDEHTRKWWKVGPRRCQRFSRAELWDGPFLTADDRRDAGELRAGRDGFRERAGMVVFHRRGLPSGRLGGTQIPRRASPPMHT